MATGTWGARLRRLAAAAMVAAAAPCHLRAGDGAELTLPPVRAAVATPPPETFGMIVAAAAQETVPAGPSRSADGPAAASASAAAPAQPPGDRGKRSNILDLDIDALSQVEVKAAKSAGPKAAAPTATGSMVTPSSTDATSPATVGELLEQAPSVSVRRTSAINLDPRVRGFHTGELNASASGMTQYKTRIDIDSLFSQIDPGTVDSIEVIDGPYTALYGPGFAFLNAELFPTPRFADGFQAHGLCVLSYGTNERQFYDRKRLWAGGPDWGVQLSYGARAGSGYHPGDDSDISQIPASYRQDDIFAAVGYDLGRCTRLECDYIHRDLWNVELPGVVYDISRSATDQYNVRLIVQDDPAGLPNLLLQYWEENTRYHGDSTRPAKHATFFDTLVVDPFPFLAGGNIFSRGLSESTGVRALWTVGRKDCLHCTLGADWRQYTQEYHEVDLQADGTQAFAGDTFGIPRSTQDDVGLLAQCWVPVAPHARVVTGGRVDYVTSAFDPNDVIFQNTTNLPNGVFSPGFNEPHAWLEMAFVRGEVEPTKWLKVTAGVGFAMRSPELAELYSAEPLVPVVRFGNSYTDGYSGLTPEKDLQFDLGATATWKRLTVGARAFYADIFDYILPVPSDYSTFVPAGVPAPTNLLRNYSAFGLDPTDPTVNPLASSAALDYRYLNLTRASLAGGEMLGEARLLPWMAVDGTLAYVEGTNHDVVRFNGHTNQVIPLGGTEPLPGIYPLNGTIGVRLFEPAHQRWSFEVLTRLVAPQNRVASTFGELPTPGFGIVNLYAAYQHSPRVRFFSSIENLFDRAYYEHGSLVIANPAGQLTFVKDPGFNWIFGVEARF